MNIVTKMKLKEMGWALSASQSNGMPDKAINSNCLARITSVHRGMCRAITVNESLNLYFPGRFHAQDSDIELSPATGDFVRIGEIFIDEHNARASKIEQIYPRRSKISRGISGVRATEQVLAANVDVVFIVTSANDDFSINRLQRFILLATQGNATPIVILSKIDLMPDYQRLVAQISARLGDIEVIPLSVMQDSKTKSAAENGLAILHKKLTIGSTCVFVGSSGVGKSSIVNALLGAHIQSTKHIHQENSKGRHATTARELFFVPNAGMIIDTAGLREVQLAVDEQAVAEVFQLVTSLSQACRFSDCSHDAEPDCAIKQALENGTLMAEEYQHYLQLQQERLLIKQKSEGNNKAKPKNSKKRWKAINKNYQVKQKFLDGW